MSVILSEITVMNQNNIAIDVTLEIPLGTFFKTQRIENESTGSISVRKDDVQSIKIISAASGGHNQDTMVLDLTQSGSPYRVYIEKIDAATSIGSIHGSVSCKF